MTARLHMNGWLTNPRAKRKTRRELGLPKLRGFTRGVQGRKAGARDIPPQYRCVFVGRGNILNLHRRIVIDAFRQVKRIKAGRYCWSPLALRMHKEMDNELA